jgi:hypothetical protein
MEDRLNKSGFRLTFGHLCLIMLFGAGSIHAKTSFKNTPLYRHILRGRNSQPTTLYEKKPTVSTEQEGASLKSSDAISEAKQKNEQTNEGPDGNPEQAVRNPVMRNRQAGLMDPASFTPQMPFSEAIEILRNSTSPGLNISVLWKDLEENADIYPYTPIGIDGVSGVPLSRHLKSLLAGVSGGSPEELGYVVDDGVVVVATLESLPEKMVTRVYDITDLVGQPSTGFPQFGFGMMGMGMPGMMGMGMPGMGMQGMGMGMPFGSGYGMQGGMMPGLSGGIIGGLSPGLGTGYGSYGTGFGTSMGFSGVPYR